MPNRNRVDRFLCVRTCVDLKSLAVAANNTIWLRIDQTSSVEAALSCCSPITVENVKVISQQLFRVGLDIEEKLPISLSCIIFPLPSKPNCTLEKEKKGEKAKHAFLS